MDKYEMMITIHGNRKPTKNKNFFIDLPFFFSMVHENVFSSKPSVPQTPNNGGTIVDNAKNHTTNNCKAIICGR